MSIDLYLRARATPLKHSGAKSALKELCFICRNEDGTNIRVAVNTLAGFLGCSRRTAGKLLEWLCDAGYLELITDTHGGHKRPAEYRIVVERLAAPPEEPAKKVRSIPTGGAKNLRGSADGESGNCEDFDTETAKSVHTTAKFSHDAAKKVRTIDLETKETNESDKAAPLVAPLRGATHAAQNQTQEQNLPGEEGPPIGLGPLRALLATHLRKDRKIQSDIERDERDRLLKEQASQLGVAGTG